MNQSEEALAALDEAAAESGTEPSYMKALRVDSLRGVGRRKEAIELADQMLASQPEGPFYRLRGQLYLDTGNAEAAVPHLERAVKLSKGHYQSHYLLAQAYIGVGRKADADLINAKADEIRKDYELVVLLGREATSKPNDPVVRLRLAEICERLGDSTSARRWRKAAALCTGQKQ